MAGIAVDGPAPLTRAEVRTLLTAATAAASVLNTQPWRFAVRRSVLELSADESRHLHVVDPDGRQLVMSCGCALMNLRLAVAAMTHEPVVEVAADGAGPLLARVRLGRSRVATPDERRLSAAIPQRRTNRRPFSPEEPSADALLALRQAAEAEGSELAVLRDEAAAQVAGLVHEADRRQREDLALRAEVARWTSPGAAADEGLPAEALGPVPRRPETVTRDFGFGHVAPGRGVSDFEQTPTLLLLSTAADGRRDWLAAGQALQRVQLAATAAGLATSYLGQVLEVADLRSALGEHASGGGLPQMLVRVGYAAPSPVTPRRPVEAVLGTG